MKSLSLSKPHVVVMVGIPGAGKSFFADHFASTFQAPLLSRAAIIDRDELSGESTDRIMEYMIDQLLKTKSTIIYEGIGGTLAARRLLAKKAHDAGYDVLYVWVQTDEATARQRALKNGTNDQEFDVQVKKFTGIKDHEPSVVISGKHTYASQLKIVLRKLSASRQTSATSVTTSAVARPSAAVGRSITIR